MPSIVAENLTKRYGSFTALSNLNLKIEGSKCVGFLGPNGAGKTTTLKIFTDMIRASEGRALINGVDVHLNKKKAMSSVGALIESPEIYPALTPRDALSMVAEIRGLPRAEKRKKIEEVVSEVKMEEWLDKKVGKFSKGMKQRINIAAALLSDPDVFLLDEPTTGLDPRGMAEVRDIVERTVNDDIASLANVSSAERSDPRKVRIHFSGNIQNQERLLLELANLKIGMISFHPSASALEDTYLRLIKDTLRSER